MKRIPFNTIATGNGYACTYRDKLLEARTLVGLRVKLAAMKRRTVIIQERMRL